MRRLVKKFFILPIIVFLFTIFSIPASLFAGNADDFAEALYDFNSNISEDIEGNLSGITPISPERSATIFNHMDYISDSFGQIHSGSFAYIGLSTGDIYWNYDYLGSSGYSVSFVFEETPDYTTFTFGYFEVPDGVYEFYFDYYFISTEDPATWGEQYGDSFTVKVFGSSAVPDATIIVDIGAEDAFINEQVEDDIEFTGINQSYGGPIFGTLWQTVSCPVSPGDSVLVEFTIADKVDGLMDSVVFLDTFRFSEPVFTIEGLVEDLIILGLPNGIETELTAILDAAFKQLENGNEKAAVNQLNAFINKVEAQRGKKITDEQADMLISIAQSLMAFL